MDELIETLKRWIEKYFSIFPFERKGIYAKIITEPSKTIASEAKKTGFGIGLKDILVGITPILALSLAMLVFAFVAIAVVLTWIGKREILVAYAVPALGIVVACFIAYILFIIISWIINTLIIHIMAKLLGGKGSFGKMLGILGTLGGANGLFMIPIFFISLIPIIGQVAMIASIYAIYLQYKAIRAVHGISRNRAIAAVMVPIIISFMVFMALYMIYMVLMMGIGASD
ncbi:MAG: Yip1 family protein [Candidatus Micrarchaeota archaeon]|nr:Yip1 family protein [Candidatus Micrarchaeota archaeon]